MKRFFSRIFEWVHPPYKVTIEYRLLQGKTAGTTVIHECMVSEIERMRFLLRPQTAFSNCIAYERVLRFHSCHNIKQAKAEKKKVILAAMEKLCMLNLNCLSVDRLQVRKKTFTNFNQRKLSPLQCLDIYKHRFLPFYFSVFSLVFVSNEKIYQILKTVIGHISKHLESSSKILRCAPYFQLFSRCLEMCSITFFCVWHITSFTIPSNCANLGTTATCATLATEIWWAEVLIEQKAWSTTVFKQQCFVSVYPHRLKLVALLFSLTLKRCYVYLLRFSWTILCQSSTSVHCKYITKRNKCLIWQDFYQALKE